MLPEEHGTTIFGLWMLITAVGASLLTIMSARRRFRERGFVMRHPKHRQLNHDQIQSWGTVLGVLVAARAGGEAVDIGADADGIAGDAVIAVIDEVDEFGDGVFEFVLNSRIPSPTVRPNALRFLG